MEERRQRVRQLFHDAVELPENEREPFLRRECQGDEDLLHEVLALVRRDSPSVASPVTPVFDRLVQQEAPSSIGRYRILDRLGEGGFGEVFEAEQTEPFQRRVAIKVVKAGMDTKAVLARFEAERQVLALLNHPAIAKVYDAGETDKGRSYFVMELVPGQSITSFCDRLGLDIEARLDLFLDTCEAIRHAHQKGIIHRDLKPSNVLVSSENDHPAPKVIDFGIAKATGHALTENTLYTEAGQLVGTPEYMSPEQAELGGVDVDIRTDVYSLGVILYELLTGTLPFDPQELRTSGINRIQQIICHEEPKRPSTRLSGDNSAERAQRRASTPAKLTRGLRGDLDWIILRALEKDRNRRYASVEALADDISRFRQDRPVKAGPPSLLYRGRKFAKRYRVALSVSFVILASIFYALFESNRQRLVAEAARDESEEVTRFLSNMLRSANPRVKGKDVLVRDIVDEGAKTIENEFPDQPLVRARLMLTMGMVYTELGLADQALELVKESVELREEHLDEDNATLGYTWNVCGVLHHQSGRFEEARMAYERALEVWTRSLGPEHSNVAQVLNNMANIHWSAGEFDQARPLMERALDIRQKVRGPDHLDIAQSMNNLGALEAYAGEYDKSIDYFEQALEIRRKHLDEDHPDIAQCIQNVGESMLMAGRLAEGREHLEQALAIQLKAFGPDHRECIMTLTSLGSCATSLGDLEGARGYLTRAQASAEAALGHEHPDLASVYLAQAKLEIEQGTPGEAVPHLEHALEIYRTAEMTGHPEAEEAQKLLDNLLAPN